MSDAPNFRKDDRVKMTRRAYDSGLFTLRIASRSPAAWKATVVVTPRQNKVVRVLRDGMRASGYYGVSFWEPMEADEDVSPGRPLTGESATMNAIDSEGTPSHATPAELDLSPDDLVYWLTNGVGEVPEVDHTPWDVDHGGRTLIYVGGCVMAEVPYSDDLEDEGVLAVANAIAGAGAEILRLRRELADLRASTGGVQP